MTTEGEPGRGGARGGDATQPAEHPEPRPIQLPPPARQPTDPEEGATPGERISEQAGPEMPAQAGPGSAEAPDSAEARPDGPVPTEHAAESPGEQRSRRTGSISYQDETTEPREPTLAEKRARQEAARRAEEAERTRRAQEARRARNRKRMLIGGGVTVGVVALIAIGYASSQPDTVTARCTGPDNVVVDDSNCVQPAANSYHSGGALIPLFIGAGGRQYHYTYGGTGTIGQVATGGTTVPPKNATVVTQSGRTIQRGGFGVSRGSTGGGGGKGGSSGG